MQFEELPDLLRPEKLPYLSGMEVLPGCILHVAVLTRMPGVSPKMFSWWFGEYMQTSEHYRRWHPRDHVWMSWKDKRPGTHLGARHLVHEYIGGKLNKLQISFVPPEEFFEDALQGAPDAVAICARVGLLYQPIDIGRMVHLCVPTDWGSELHSRFWLGYIHSRSGARIPEAGGNLPPVRRWLARASVGRALAVHCHEEMTTLATFLPDLYGAQDPCLAEHEARGGNSPIYLDPAGS